MQLIEKFLSLFGWAFVVTLGTIMITINIVPIIALFVYCGIKKIEPREIVELVFSH